VFHNKLTVAHLLAWFEPPLAEPDPGLEFVVENSISTEQKEEVLLVALAGLALDVPVVLPGHVVLVLLLVLVVHPVGEVGPSLLQGGVGGEEVSHELLAGFVHDTTDHGLGHLLELSGRSNTSGGRVAVKYNLGTRILPHFAVGQHIHNLHWINSSFAVMFLDGNL